MPIARIYQAASPFNAAELADLDYEQVADVFYFAHNNHAPTKLIRYAHSDWRFTSVTAGPTIAAPTAVGGTATTPNTDSANSGNAYFPQPATYCVTAINEDTGQESRASTTVTLTNDMGLKRNFNTITWAAVTNATAYRVYKADNTQIYGSVGTTTSLTFRDDNIGADLSEGPPLADNPFAASGDYPGTVAAHEQRMCWGRTTNRPNAVYFSRSADFDNMDYTRPSRADDAFLIGLVARKVNSVNQLVSTNKGLLALTSHNIFSIQGSNEDYIAASPPPRVRPEISRGVSRLNPIVVDNTTFYETAKTGEVRTIGYQYQIDGVQSDDLTIFSRHLFKNTGIVAWAYVEKPGSTILVVRTDGKCLCLTWDQAQQVWGWTVYETDGLFKDVAVITEQDEDRAYFKVERTINGTVRTFIERMASELWEEQEDACYLDCARTFTNTVTVNQVNRLDHLNGETVTAWVDGQAYHGLNVVDGKLQLPASGKTISIGLPFVSRIQTLPLAVQTGGGWSVAKPQDASTIVIRAIRSRNLYAGPGPTQLFSVRQPTNEDPLGPIELVSGDLQHAMPGKSGTEVTVYVESRDPTPMHIGAILIDPTVGEP